MKKYKKLTFGIIAAIICAAVCTILLITYSKRPVIKTPFSMVYDVIHTNSSGGSEVSFSTRDDDYIFVKMILHNGVDVTERFDPEKVAVLLSNCMSRRTGSLQDSSADMQWEIEIMRSNSVTIHVCIGRPDTNSGNILSYWYLDSRVRTYYKILDPYTLATAMASLME